MQTGKMFMPIIRYKNESNSQPPAPSPRRACRCLCQSLDTRMKAIHNFNLLGHAADRDVYANH